MTIQFTGLPHADVAAIKQRGTDVYGLPVERQTSPGTGIPCRHCLKVTPEGEDFLILAHRPFSGLNAYTETGPIFLCAEACEPAAPSAGVPPMLTSPEYILRGYTGEERIEYGTGRVVPTEDIPAYAAELLQRPEIAFVDIRSATNNCYKCRVVRADAT